MNHEKYMKKALKLAEKGCGKVSPNPMVGAVIVKDEEIIGEGWHEQYGGLHAERNALKNCTQSAKGATMYVTLEPCCHHGKTPPCTDAIIENEIARVVIGSSDPNPLVAGNGIKILRENGIEVIENVLKEECDMLNKVFLHYIKTNMPYVVMKYAMTLDGKIATYTGKSKWITGEKARENVHQDRNRYTVIMVGVETVIADNPMLTCHMCEGKNPIRVICDTNLRTPHSSRIVQTSKDVKTFIATCCKEEEKQRSYIDAGCEIIEVTKKEKYLNLAELIKKLGESGIDSVLLEGGGTLNWSALDGGLVNKVQVYIAPKIFGGDKSKTPVRGIGVESPDQAFQFKNMQVKNLGDDILIECEVNQNVYRDS